MSDGFVGKSNETGSPGKVDMTNEHTSAVMRKAYAKWAPIYDVVYDKLTEAGARAAVRAAVSAGPKILEAGVGTGLALGYYPGHTEVYGVDLSAEMLKRAQEKVDKHRMQHVKSLRVMDVCSLDYPDGTFDAVAAQFIITLVPQPERALNEFSRVLKPGGEIVLVNHFGKKDGPVAKMEALVAPLVAKIGWSSSFKATRIEHWARQSGLFDVVSLSPVFPGGFFKLMRLRKRADADVGSQEASAVA